MDEKRVQACDAIEDAYANAEADCVDDCAGDLELCPMETDTVLDCVLANQSQPQCDPDEEQGLVEAPCEAQHAAVQAPHCELDPF